MLPSLAPLNVTPCYPSSSSSSYLASTLPRLARPGSPLSTIISWIFFFSKTKLTNVFINSLMTAWRENFRNFQKSFFSSYIFIFCLRFSSLDFYDLTRSWGVIKKSPEVWCLKWCWQCWPPAVPGSIPEWPDWTPRKLDKQRSERSVTFASIDPLEPIEEDLPQVRIPLDIWLDWIWSIVSSYQESRVWGELWSVYCTFVPLW